MDKGHYKIPTPEQPISAIENLNSINGNFIFVVSPIAVAKNVIQYTTKHLFISKQVQFLLDKIGFR